MYEHVNRSTAKDVGITVAIGLIFALLIAVSYYGIYQTEVVPIQEQETEFEHNRLVQQQLSSLGTEISGASSTNEVRTQSVQIGTSYDQQLLFGFFPIINQPPPSGSITYEEFDDPAGFTNIKGQSGASEYWSGGDKTFDTGFIEYDIDYNRYQRSPTVVYEHGVIYNEFENGNEKAYSYSSDQQLIRGNNISLILLDGELDLNTTTTRNVEAVPVSAPAQTIAVESDDDNPVVLEIPTKLPEEQWEELLEDENNVDNLLYTENADDTNVLEIELDPTTNYTLTLSKVFMTTRTAQTTAPSENERYIGWDENEVIVREESRTQINAQVRDRFDNPVTGVDVFAYARDGNGECIGDFRSGPASNPPEACGNQVAQPGIKISAQNGQVSYVYESPRVDEDTQINVSLRFDDD